jgi:RalA-binding protein 1
MAYARAPTSSLPKVQVLLDPPVINQLTQVRGHVSVFDCPSSLLSSQWLGLGADPHTLTPQWQPTSRAPPIVTVSHSSLDALDISVTPPMESLPHTRQQPSIRTLNVSKVDDRLGADRGSSPSSQSTSPSLSANFLPNSVSASGSSTASPLETTASSSSQSGILFLTRPQAASRESRITLPEEAKQYISSVMDSPTNSHLVLEPGRSHSRGQSPAPSSAHNVPDSRDSATDKSSTRRDLSDGEFLDLEDSDSLYDSAADHSLTSPTQDSRIPDDTRQPHLAVPPAADDFPLPPGMANASNGDSNLGTPQAIPAIQRTRKVDGPDSPTTPTPNAYGSRSSVMSVYQSVIPEELDSQVQFRALPLLPHDLPYTRVTVTNSSIRPNDRGKDVLSFVVMVDPGNQKESYLIEKLYSDVLGLDQRIRARYGKSIHKKIPHLPDGKLWRDHAPSRVDQRKV